MSASEALVSRSLQLAHRARTGRGTVVLGISGPQGAGKSTVAAAVVARATSRGERAVAISIDDFYLERAAQVELSNRHPGNRYLEHRGCPGTHDVALGTATLAALRGARVGDVVPLPRYDKGAHGGRGDRAARATWASVEGPVDLVVLEGWMLGFPRVTTDGRDAALDVTAAMLAPYEAWWRELDAFVHLEAADVAMIVAWRVDAERARRLAGGPALTDEEARDYIERFVPAYRLWVPALHADPPKRDGRRLPWVHAILGADREPVSISEGADQPDLETIP